MPRPPKSDGEKRTQKIEVRVSPAEKIHLHKLASEYGMTASDLMRNRAIGSAQVRTVATPDRAILLKLLAESGKQGSNLNQMAHVLNRLEKTGELGGVSFERLTRALEENEALTQLIRSILKNGS